MMCHDCYAELGTWVYGLLLVKGEEDVTRELGLLMLHETRRAEAECARRHQPVSPFA